MIFDLRGAQSSDVYRVAQCLHRGLVERFALRRMRVDDFRDTL